MVSNGANHDLLVKALKKIGPRCGDAVDYLGLSLHIVGWLPGNRLYALDAPERRLIVKNSDEQTIWIGVAHFVAILCGIDPDFWLCVSVASTMCRRSGVFAAPKQIA